MPAHLALILAGGGGTRLWPASTADRPKHLIPGLSPGSAPPRSLIEATIERIAPLHAPEDCYLVTTTDQLDALRASLPGIPAENFIVEPEGRNTAMCVALALSHLHARRSIEDCTLTILPADHHVADREAFRTHLQSARIHARSGGGIVTLGIHPTAPETGYGYIEREAEALPALDGDSSLPVYPARRFVEKPDVERARSYLAAGNFLWNAGIFVASIPRLLSEYERCTPALWRRFEALREGLRRGDDTREATAHAYGDETLTLPIDVAIMEMQGDLRVIPCAVGWSDLGSWSALHRCLGADGNAIIGDPERSQLIDVERSLVWNEDATVGLIGVSDLAVVVSRGRVLICPLDRAQEVRALAKKLEES